MQRNEKTVNDSYLIVKDKEIIKIYLLHNKLEELICLKRKSLQKELKIQRQY